MNKRKPIKFKFGEKLTALKKVLFSPQPKMPVVKKGQGQSNEPPKIDSEAQLLVDYALTNNPLAEQIISASLKRYLSDVIDEIIVERTRLNQQSNVVKMHEIGLLREEAKLKEELAEKEQKYLKDLEKIHQKLTFYLNQYVVLLVLFTLFGLLGATIGINLPQRVECWSEHSPCWHLRLREKQIRS
jgi:hypothetical protein